MYGDLRPTSRARTGRRSSKQPVARSHPYAEAGGSWRPRMRRKMRRTRLRAGRRSKRSGSRAWAPCASRCISLARYLTSSASSSGVCLGGCGPNIHITPITLDFTPSLGDMPGMIARRSVLANVVQQRLWTRGDEAEYHARQRGVWLQVGPPQKVGGQLTVGCTFGCSSRPCRPVQGRSAKDEDQG